jgi:hypothetical protein
MANNPFEREGRKVREIYFSPEEMADLWREVLSQSGVGSNDDFGKAFEQALRIRAMKKLSLFAGKGMVVRLATGPNYTQERWLGTELADGGVVLNVEEEKK